MIGMGAKSITIVRAVTADFFFDCRVNNIRMDLGEVGWGDLDWIGLAKGQVESSCQFGDEHSVFHEMPGKLSSGLTSSGPSSSVQLHRVR
jgi:hypothetical protein